MVFPPIWGEKWRRSEHAHASYPGLLFRPPGFSPYRGGKKGEFRDWTRLEPRPLAPESSALTMRPPRLPNVHNVQKPRKKASQKIGEKCFLSPYFAHTFSLAVFRAMPQLTERLEEPTNLFLVTHVSIIFRPKSYSGRE